MVVANRPHMKRHEVSSVLTHKLVRLVRFPCKLPFLFSLEAPGTLVQKNGKALPPKYPIATPEMGMKAIPPYI